MALPTTPSRKPVGIQLTQATGQPVPGANAQTYTRKTASAGDAKTALGALSTPVGLTPQNVAVNKDTSPQSSDN
jgi:hypothetical protein